MANTLPPSNADRNLTILQEAVENTNEAFVTINQEHKVIFFNQAAERIFGYSREEVLGKDLDIILTPRCSKNHRNAVERYLKTKKPVLIGHETEFLATRKNGELFSAAISFSVSEVDGKLFFTALIRDVTETKKLQERLINSQRLAVLGHLVAEITHEIKNPLIIIGGFAQQLKKSLREEKDINKLNIIIAEIERLENLLKELREVYLPHSLNLTIFDINELLNEVYLFTPDNGKKKKILTTFKPENDNLFIEGDREKLKQVLINIIKNAAEAINDTGNISIRSSLVNRQVEIEIADDGPGIAPINQDKIFDPFFTTKKQGTGLGLPICKRIIEDHSNASLSIKSEEGKGTVVKLTFPLINFKPESLKEEEK